MRKVSILLSLLVLAALTLAACGGGATSTNVAGSPPAMTAEATEDMGATEAPTQAATDVGAATEPAGVPVTGDADPARLSNQMALTVWSQDGEQIGSVNDMVLDLDNSRVAYAVVSTGGFLDLGDREILVPWDQLQLQSGAGDMTRGEQNAFILQTDLDVFRNAPNFDLAGNMPTAGQQAGDWDVDLRTYWESGGTTGGTDTTGTASPEVTGTGAGGTDTGTGTATEPAGAGTDQGTATADPGTGTGQGTDTGQNLQGVVLASEVLGSTISMGAQGTGQADTTGTDQGQATAPAAGTDTGTASPDATAVATDTGEADTTATIEDLITDIDTGEILYIVLMAGFADGERWIPVPLSQFEWDTAMNAFMLNVDAAGLPGAPFFQNGEFPDTSMSGWNSEFDTFWQNNTGGADAGGGTDAQATSTP